MRTERAAIKHGDKRNLASIWRPTRYHIRLLVFCQIYLIILHRRLSRRFPSCQQSKRKDEKAILLPSGDQLGRPFSKTLSWVSLIALLPLLSITYNSGATPRIDLNAILLPSGEQAGYSSDPGWSVSWTHIISVRRPWSKCPNRHRGSMQRQSSVRIPVLCCLTQPLTPITVETSIFLKSGMILFIGFVIALKQHSSENSGE